MILDKTSIEEILYTESSKFDPIKDQKKDGIYIRTITGENAFSKEQIGNDSIDLRISNHGYIMLSEYDYINTLSEDSLEKYYKEVSIKETGYILNPGDLLFITTFERIALSGNLIGRVTGRSVFARMGLSVHCTQDKFSSGINSVAGLQIVNNSPIPLKIFPYQKLAQILIERTGENRHPYDGAYCNEVNYTLPSVKDKDRSQYSEMNKNLILKQKPKKLPLRKRKKTNATLSFCKLIVTILGTVFMGICGITNNIPVLVSVGVAELVASICFLAIEFDWWGKNED